MDLVGQLPREDAGGRARGDTSPALTSQEAEWRGQVFEAGESISDGVLDGRLGGMSVR